MNPAQIHLALNHLPIAFVLVGVPLLAIALYRKSQELKTVGAVLLMLSAFAVVPVFLSGEPTEKVVEHQAGVSEKVIEAHEEAAEASLIVTVLLGFLAIAGSLYERTRRALPIQTWLGLVILGVITIALFVRTAHLGGLIRHPEIASGSVATMQGGEEDDD